MVGIRIRLAAVVTILATAMPAAQVSGPEAEYRQTVTRMLEAMIATGLPSEADHDDGQWLQDAVDDLIARGAPDVERLAIRAAAPLRVWMSHPIGSADSPPGLSVAAQNVLKLRNPMPYTATIFASLDGGDLVEVARQESGKGGGARLDATLGKASTRPGGHHLRLRAHLVFGQPGKPAWTEVRDLPEVVYGIYDGADAASVSARRLLYGPAAFTAADFDPTLPRQPLEAWLAELTAPYKRNDRGEPMWSSFYCAMRTADPRGPVDSSAVCAVLFFGTANATGQLWFRTADVQLQDGRVIWMPLETPRFEGVIVGERNADRLSALPSLLAAPEGRGGDVAIFPTGISISETANGTKEAVITVRNMGEDHLFNVSVEVFFGADPRGTVGRRHLVVSVPPGGMKEIRAAISLTGPYGFVMAHAFQRTEHSPLDGTSFDPTPEDSCAVRVLNAAAVPPDVLAEFKRPNASLCQVQFR